MSLVHSINAALKSIFRNEPQRPPRSSLISIDLAPSVHCSDRVKIDDHSTIGDYTYLGRDTAITNSAVGRYCSIGAFVLIGPGEHDLTKISTSSLFYENIYETLTQHECTIGPDVWIGSQAIVKRNVRVGVGAVVGANSVVTKDVPDFAIVAGVPARVLRFRFSTTFQEKILASEWWKLELSEARQAHRKLLNSVADADLTEGPQ